MYSLSYRLAAQQLREIDPGVRLVVIHPNCIQQHLLIAELLTEAEFAYVRFDGKDLTRAQLEAQLEQALIDQFGEARLSGARYLVLDECDCVSSDDLGQFLHSFLNEYADIQILLFARQPLVPVLHEVSLREQAAFIPVEESLMLWDYARRDENTPILLEVRALGTGRVLLNGRAVDDWDGVLPRSLFFYLVDKGMTTRSDIFETFWPNLTVREATNVFHVTKRKISEVLGVDLTTYWSGFYRVSPDIELSYDVVQFSELVQSSVVEKPSLALEMLQRAVWLYRDDFLTSLQSDWVLNRREELRQTYSDSLISLAKLVERDGQAVDGAESLGLYLRALHNNPQREDVAHSTMMLYRQMGRFDDALVVYDRLRNELQHNLGVAPARYLQELAYELEAEEMSSTDSRL